MASNLFRGYKITILITFLIISIGALGLGFAQFINRLEYEKYLIRKQFERSVSNLELIIMACVNHVEGMRIESEDYFNNSRQKTDREPLFEFLKYDSVAKYTHLDSLPSGFPTDMTANLTGPFDVNNIKGTDLEREVNMALALNTSFKVTSYQTPNVAWIYYTSPRLISIYPWVTSSVFKYTDDLLSHDFYSLAEPRKNPYRNLFWTPAYIDEAGKGMMVTCAAPVYDFDEFMGSVALDLTFDSLNSIISNSQLNLGEIFIINRQNQLLAHPDLVSSSDSSVKRLQDVFDTKLYEKVGNLWGYEDRSVHLAAGYFIYYEKLPNTDWKLIYLVPEWDLYFSVLGKIGWGLLFVVVSMSVVMLISNRIITKGFIQPASGLVDHLQKEHAGVDATINAKTPKSWKVWYQIISDIFSQNRRLVSELEAHNRKLEQQVKERTAELEQQAKELAQKNDDLIASEEEIRQAAEELSATNDHLAYANQQLIDREEKLNLQNHKLEAAYKEIQLQNEHTYASISYARRIQQAILGSQEGIIANFKSGFILFEPRDIVSGDFYWHSQVDDLQILIAADCTGHGVPGAFMTVMGNALLNAIILEEKIRQPDLILSRLDEKVQAAFQNQNNGHSRRHDGMDMSVLLIDKKKKTLDFAGAKSPLCYVREDKMYRIKGSPYPIGSSQFSNKHFENHQLELQKGDKIYIFSDGYQDQFGGAENRKFMSKNFRNLLLNIAALPMKAQKIRLEQELQSWKNEQKQTDDILVIGLEIL
ncbi:MAG: SpoIIE family protein phosphatase [Bernardetiaceae bacterium]|nr:SpoIIE family protein phosphatase [Bernardetiaceae bacterium]